jgi:hypothetical protein
MKLGLLVLALLLYSGASAQSFEVAYTTEAQHALIGETAQVPIRITNRDSKPLALIIRKAHSSLGSTQKAHFCLTGHCREGVDEITVKLEPGQILTDLLVSFEAGLAAGLSTSKFLIVSKTNPTESIEVDIALLVEEPVDRKSIYNSPFITVHDVYPNPAIEWASIDYKIHQPQPSYAITVRNLLGNVMHRYALPAGENRLKMHTEELTPGIYFFTLYIDNEGVMTRKMMVKK